MSHEIRIPIYPKAVFHGKSRVWLDRCSGMSMPLRVVHKLVEAGFERSSNPLELWVFSVVGHFSTNGSFFGYPPNATLPMKKGQEKREKFRTDVFFLQEADPKSGLVDLGCNKSG